MKEKLRFAFQKLAFLTKLKLVKMKDDAVAKQLIMNRIFQFIRGETSTEASLVREHL